MANWYWLEFLYKTDIRQGSMLISPRNEIIITGVGKFKGKSNGEQERITL